jgi:hypothetical protein
MLLQRSDAPGTRVVNASLTTSRLATDLRAPLQLAHTCIEISSGDIVRSFVVTVLHARFSSFDFDERLSWK